MFEFKNSEMFGQLAKSAKFSKLRHNTIPRARQNLLSHGNCYVSVCLSLVKCLSSGPGSIKFHKLFELLVLLVLILLVSE